MALGVSCRKSSERLPILALTKVRTVRSFVDKRLDSKEHFDDMMQILIESGVSREQLIQQTLIAV